MAVYRCAQCREDAEILPRDGYEIVSVYCVKHRSGLGGHIIPVRMELVPEAAPDPVPEIPEPVGAG